ncbi:MAG: galactosyltransferase-related protein [Synechococcus sp.]|nr:galactosyltransferase-related protein [Synechococcus sp.]
MRLSLLTIYRDRPQHLASQLAWWQSQPDLANCCEWLIIEAALMPTIDPEQLPERGIQHHFLPQLGVLHKTQALNFALDQAQGQYITPFDVDLIPLGDTLVKHLCLAEQSPQMLLAGYRLMAPVSTVEPENMATVITQGVIAPEDQPSALYKHLLQGERFGTLPFFERQRLLDIDGWDETFIGWGAEDQDLIERYLGQDLYLCRSPHLVYLHLHHDPDPQWREPELTAANRAFYYQKQRIQ